MSSIAPLSERSTLHQAGFMISKTKTVLWRGSSIELPDRSEQIITVLFDWGLFYCPCMPVKYRIFSWLLPESGCRTTMSVDS